MAFIDEKQYTVSQGHAITIRREKASVWIQLKINNSTSTSTSIFTYLHNREPAKTMLFKPCHPSHPLRRLLQALPSGRRAGPLRLNAFTSSFFPPQLWGLWPPPSSHDADMPWQPHLVHLCISAAESNELYWKQSVVQYVLYTHIHRNPFKDRFKW